MLQRVSIRTLVEIMRGYLLGFVVEEARRQLRGRLIPLIPRHSSPTYDDYHTVLSPERLLRVISSAALFLFITELARHQKRPSLGMAAARLTPKE